MQEKLTLHRWLLTAWLMLWGCLLSVAFGQQYGTLYRGSTYYPTVTSSSRSSSPASAYIRSSSAPTYDFQSTSSQRMMNGGTTISASQVCAPFASRPAQSGALRSGWGDPEDPGTGGYESGVVPDPAPIGEPWALMVMALLFLLWSGYKFSTKRKEEI